MNGESGHQPLSLGSGAGSHADGTSDWIKPHVILDAVGTTTRASGVPRGDVSVAFATEMIGDQSLDHGWRIAPD